MTGGETARTKPLCGAMQDAGERLCLERGKDVSPEEVARIAEKGATVVLGAGVIEDAKAAHETLEALVESRKRIYGVTTGYGPLASNFIDPAQSAQLQRNLIYHLASGVGEPLRPDMARAVTFARLCALSKGHSGSGINVIELLCAVLNAGLAPVIPEKGTVGASGDLTPLSHMALALIGEGAFFKDGRTLPATVALQAAGLSPLALGRKDAIALVNGTSAMTGIAALNGVRLRRLLAWSVGATLLYTELFSGHREAWHPLIGQVRGHPGQVRMHVLLWDLSQDSARLQPFEGLETLPAETAGEGVLSGQALPQDPYSSRCAPQLLGAIADVLTFHDDVVTRDLNAVSDNPLVFSEEGMVLHGGNFFGQHVSFASDTLMMAIIKLALHSERKLARLTDDARNGALPPFLQGNRTGLNSGFMGAQVTASALVAEMRAKAVPASIQSISTNADNQDVVTLGTVAARRAADMLADAARVLAIEVMALAQACELSGGPGGNPPFAGASRALFEKVRSLTDFIEDDRPLSQEIETVADCLLSEFPAFLKGRSDLA